jgi:precorrin-4/cobalt-precorrin-4 C11-methyltransferase
VIRFVGAGPGDPELLTRKGERLLRECGLCVWAGSLVNPSLLELLPKGCEVHDSARLDLEATTALLVSGHERGLETVRLHTGDPSLYGAIGEQIRRLRELGIPSEVVPGVSSFQAAAAALGTELTAPEVSQAVVICRTSGRTPVPLGQSPSDFAGSGATLCIFLSALALDEELSRIASARGADCPAAAVWRASWPEERIVRGTVSSLAGQVRAAGFDRQVMVLVGRALEGGTFESRLYAREFSHGWRKAGGGKETLAGS